MRRGGAAAGITALVVALGLLAQAPAGGQERRGGLELRPVGSFDQPIYAHGPRGAPRLLFVVEREGRVVVLKGGEPRGTFLNIAKLVSCCDSERGLFSIAFAPWRKHRFYVFFTDQQGDLRISEFKRSRRHPLRAVRGSRRDLLDIPHRQAANHNGGQLQWGPGGRLFISTGDGGATPRMAQDKGSLLGKILRIDPLRRRGHRYAVPRDNPYVGRAGKDQIFARGLRNPWRFSFSGRKLAIGDVGESSFEEVDFERLGQARGANFGWANYEANILHLGPPLSNHDRPIHTYSHGGGRCAITGGYVVRDRSLASLRGRYVYGDLCTGQIRSLRASTGGASGDSATGLARSPLVSFGEDARRRVYVVAGDTVYRIAD